MTVTSYDDCAWCQRHKVAPDPRVEKFREIVEAWKPDDKETDMVGVSLGVFLTLGTTTDEAWELAIHARYHLEIG